MKPFKFMGQNFTVGKNGVIRRVSSTLHSHRQKQAQKALAATASSMFNQGKSPGEIRDAIRGACSGHNKYGGATAMESKRQAKHQAAIAFVQGVESGYSSLPPAGEWRGTPVF